MHVQMFGSTEEMLEAIEANRAAAMKNLAPQQKALTLGDYWVQFADLDTSPPTVIFGHVFDEAWYRGNAAKYPEEGTAENQTAEALASLDENGLMFGIAASWMFPDDEMGYTHQVSVWPIEERLYDMARAAKWNINLLPDVGRVLLEVAFRSQKAWVLSQGAADPHEVPDAPSPSRSEVHRVLRDAFRDQPVKLENVWLERTTDEIMQLIEG